MVVLQADLAQLGRRLRLMHEAVVCTDVFGSLVRLPQVGFLRLLDELGYVLFNVGAVVLRRLH